MPCWSIICSRSSRRSVWWSGSSPRSPPGSPSAAAAAGHRPRPIGRLDKTSAIATGVTVLTLLGILVATMLTGRAMDALRVDDPVRIQVTGNQWWWDIQYPDAYPSLRVITANEIHIPVGRQVRIDMLSNDVIHSLWIPEPAGQDRPGPRPSEHAVARGRHPGVFRGQCAEYLRRCSTPRWRWPWSPSRPATSKRWLMANRAPAPDTGHAGAAARRRTSSVQGPCAMCHAIAGTSAGGRTAPDLTHVASRSTLAAGTLPNTPRLPRRLDRRSAARQAGQPHAADRAAAAATCRPCSPIWRR